MQKYHMRRHDREIKDSVQLSTILRQGKYMVLALAHLDDPYIVTAMTISETLFISTAPKMA